jgi:intracellular sulfur oxidation DsrE/DsrF family protein
MTKMLITVVFLILTAIDASAQWGKPRADVVPEADGFVTIPKASVPIEKKRIYRAVYDATRAAADPSKLVPALNMAGSELNGFAASGVSQENAKFIIVFHGPAVDGILDDAHYKAKFGIANPNLKVLSELKKAGVAIYVCGQHLAGENIDPKILSRDVTVAADALIVLMAYQNDGYAVLSF